LVTQIKTGTRSKNQVLLPLFAGKMTKAPQFVAFQGSLAAKMTGKSR